MSLIKSHKGRRLYFFTKGLIKIVDSLSPILSLGFYWTDLEYKYTKRDLFKNNKNEKAN